MVADRKAIQSVLDFASEAEEILSVSGIAVELKKISEDQIATAERQSRSLDLGDVGSIAGAIIALFMWIGQYRSGKILRGATRNEVIHDLGRRALESDSLTSAAKERLVSRALDRVSKEEE